MAFLKVVRRITFDVVRRNIIPCTIKSSESQDVGIFDTLFVIISF